MQIVSTPVASAPSAIVATIIERENGAPMRHITNGRRHRAVGSYYSMKNGKGVTWESRVELYAHYHAEVDTNVRGYRAQPHKLEMFSEGHRFTYTPDRENQLADGRIEIVEIKDRHNPADDPDYTSKLAMAEAVYRSLGWSFRIMEREQLEAEPRFSAVETLQCYRRTALTINDIEALNALSGNNRPLTLGDLCEALGPPEVGLRKASAMTVRRLVAIELDRGLVSEAAVQLMQEVANV